MVVYSNTIHIATPATYVAVITVMELSLLDLPEDLIQYCMCELNVQQLLPVMLTCKQLHSIVDSEYMWASLYQRYFGKLDDSLAKQTAKEAFRSCITGFQYSFGNWVLLHKRHGMMAFNRPSPTGLQLHLPIPNSTTSNHRLLVKTRFVMYAINETDFNATYMFARPHATLQSNMPPFQQSLHLWGWDIVLVPSEDGSSELIVQNATHPVGAKLNSASKGELTLFSVKDPSICVQLFLTDGEDPLKKFYMQLNQTSP